MTLPMRREPMVTVAFMEKTRREDMKAYKKRTNHILWLTVLYLVTMRLTIDLFFRHPWIKDYQQFYPLSIVLLLFFFWFIWKCGKVYIFQQRYGETWTEK